jgi:iron complex outermembrane receptor protein
VSRGAALDGELGFNNRQGEDTRQVNHNLVTQSNDEQTSLTFSADYDFANNYVLSLVTGWRAWENTEIREGDFLPRPVVGTAELHDLGKVETDQFSLEVRLASAQDKAFRYQVGAFYWASDNSQDFTRDVISCASSTLPVAPSGATPCNLINPNLTTPATLFPTATSRSDVNVENTAVFGQADFDVTPQITATLGLRYTNDTLDYVHTRAPGVDAVTGRPATGPGVSGNPAGGTLASGGNGTNTSFGSSDNSNVSGKAALTWQPTDNFTGFASYTRGYKGPAFNVFFNHTAPTNAVPIDEETSDSYEIGFKSRWFGNRAELNVSVFDVTYEGFQANNFVLLNGAVVTNLTNAGTVGSTGFEVDAVWLAMEGLTLRSSVAYADATVEQFNPNPLTNAPDARNGTRLPLAPEWAYNVGGEYENDWAFGKYYVNTLYSYTGDQFSDLGEGGPLESYGVLNGSIGFSDASDTFRLTFIGRNLLDESYVLLNTSNGQRLHIPRDADRYFGVGLRAKF